MGIVFWTIERSEKWKKLSFVNTNEIKQMIKNLYNEFKETIVLPKERFFWTNLKNTIVFYSTNDFSNKFLKKTIVFYGTTEFTERIFSEKTNKKMENER